jgi:hypothetical protein
MTSIKLKTSVRDSDSMGAKIRLHDDISVGVQLLQRFANRDGTDAGLLGQILNHQPHEQVMEKDDWVGTHYD